MAEVKRCTIGLGTFVEFTLPDSTPLEIYYAAVIRMNELEDRLSVFRENSDVSRWNRMQPGESAEFDPDFVCLLELCARLNSLSRGVFDPRTEPTTLLPLSETFHNNGATIRKVHSMTMDLGGIAKGYIVDRLVEYLESAGLASGVVNAGGDLRCWGTVARPVHIRFAKAAVSSECFEMENGAIASSGWDSHCSVRAESAVLADAFTKIFLADRELANFTAAQLGAEVQLVAWIGATNG